jgi:hypothetical protein
MEVERFWQMIEAAHRDSGGENQKKFDLLVEQLSQESEDTIQAFAQTFHRMTKNAERAILWDAAIFINGGCGNDSFDDFKAWLVAQGREVYEKALLNPDSLADVVREDTRDTLDTQFESFAYASHYAYGIKTGQVGLPDNFRYSEIPSVDFGEFSDEDDYPTLFPKLFAKLGDWNAWWDVYLGKTESEIK